MKNNFKSKAITTFFLTTTLAMAILANLAVPSQVKAAPEIVPWSGKILHYELYATDAYINTQPGVFPSTDPSNIAGWPSPVYTWGFTDVDPGGPLTAPGYLNLQTIPARSAAPKGTFVGNAKFTAPFLEATVGDDVYITLHNRGFFQKKQKVQDEHTIHLHGIHSQAQFDGFPESAGSYQELLQAFWQEPTYGGSWAAFNNLVAGGSPLATWLKDSYWNSLSGAAQQAFLLAHNASGTNTIPTILNKLSPSGGVPSQFDTVAFPAGTPAATIEAGSQFTYYFRAEHPGTYMYHCHVTASEHVQMGMYGALVIRPSVNSTTSVYGGVPDGAGNFVDSYDKEYTFIESEFDPVWHSIIESGVRAFYPPNWKPQLWFVNGRTFPQTIFKFRYNALEPVPPVGFPLPPGVTVPPSATVWNRPEPRYDTFITVTFGQRFLARYINMGYQAHPIHQHGWHMTVIGSDGMPFRLIPNGNSTAYSKFTLNIGSGETYDTITLADPVYGVNAPSGSPFAQPVPPPSGSGTLNWRQVYPIHDHDDYKVTTNGIYPGGALVLIEATGVPNTPPGTPTYANPYLPPPGIGPLPPIPPA